MKAHYSISIPKPCHEDWSKMTPNEKGRLCLSCSKTVVDFTKMKTAEIHDYLHHNKDQRICGHIKQSQLDTINLKVPETVFNQNLDFHRLFLLALLFSMGLTLFNCEDSKGNTKKIENVEIIETHQKSTDTILNDERTSVQLDSGIQKKMPTQKIKTQEQHLIEGMMIIETIGDITVEPVDVNDIDPIDIDSIEVSEPPYCPTSDDDDDLIIGMLIPEYLPEFINTPHSLSSSEKKKYMSNKISEIVNKNFNIEIVKEHGIKGKHRIYTQFKIDKNGTVKDIKVRTSHSALENEVLRVINLLPQFKPAEQRGKNIAFIYTLPIVFIIED